MANTEEPSHREQETREYLEEHRILDLFNNLTAQLIFKRPEEPKKYMIETLERLQKSRAMKQTHPCLFDDSNIMSTFGMLDPTNKGHITMAQYKEALITLGIKDFPEHPEGEEDDCIVFDTFFNAAKDGLQKASATFST